MALEDWAGLQRSSKSNEWYTPGQYIRAARLVLGAIDLDPASCAYANATVQATTYYTEEQNGLARPWYGRVWCNPPYGYVNGRSGQALWSGVMVERFQRREFTAGILLVSAVPEKKWFQRLWDYPMCLTDHRVSFYNETAPQGEQGFKGSAFVYMGDQIDLFRRVFEEFGPVVHRLRASCQHVQAVAPYTQPLLF